MSAMAAGPVTQSKRSGPHLLPSQCAEGPRRLPCRQRRGAGPPRQRAATAAACRCARPPPRRPWHIAAVAKVHIRQPAALAMQHAPAPSKAAAAQLAKTAAAGAAAAARGAAAAAGGRGLAARQAGLAPGPAGGRGGTSRGSRERLRRCSLVPAWMQACLLFLLLSRPGKCTATFRMPRGTPMPHPAPTHLARLPAHSMWSTAQRCGPSSHRHRLMINCWYSGGMKEEMTRSCMQGSGGGREARAGVHGTRAREG